MEMRTGANDMAKLWASTGDEIDKKMEEFLSGKDAYLDQKLVKWDALTIAAHDVALAESGLLSHKELGAVLGELLRIYKDGLEFGPDLEDVHTAIETALAEKLGETGKKIRAGISRNDQIIADIKLFAKAQMIETAKAVLKVCESLDKLAEQNATVPMPGYTHLQRAMPYTAGSYFAAHLHGLLDDLKLMWGVYDFIDTSPLGAGVGYGNPLGPDKERIAALLGFKKADENSLAATNLRGKLEASIVAALLPIALDISRLATDLILFSTKEFGFFSLPREVCTGSSMMPQKRNPDPLELVRAKCTATAGAIATIVAMVSGLPSGYNRDLQETKGPLMESIENIQGCLAAMDSVLRGLAVNKDNLANALSPDIFATHRAAAITKGGVPYRKAYGIVAEELASGKTPPPVAPEPELGYKKKFIEAKKEVQHIQEKFWSGLAPLLKIMGS